MTAATEERCDDCQRYRYVVHGTHDGRQLCAECYMATADTLPEPEPAVHADVVRLLAGVPASTSAAEVSVVSLQDFIAVDEPGAKPLVGTTDDNLIPQGGDVMLYGDGGTAKTTLTVDLAFHLDEGRDWLGYRVPQPARVMLVENEGPRALFREKLRRKTTAWPGAHANIHVWERPWATFTFADASYRAEFALKVTEREIDVVIAGPVAAIGMDSAGTLQEVRAFMDLIRDVRSRVERPLTVILVHHENKGGAVSGAWEGAGDTLLHTTGAGHGHTHVFIQKSRWASFSHHTTLKLAWADGDTFELEGERDLYADVAGLLADGKPRTIDEIRSEINAGKGPVSELITDERADDFNLITGEDAKALGRSVKAKLYVLVRGLSPVESSERSTGPQLSRSASTGLQDSPVRSPVDPGESVPEPLVEAATGPDAESAAVGGAIPSGLDPE